MILHNLITTFTTADFKALHFFPNLSTSTTVPLMKRDKCTVKSVIYVRTPDEDMYVMNPAHDLTLRSLKAAFPMGKLNSVIAC